MRDHSVVFPHTWTAPATSRWVADNPPVNLRPTSFLGAPDEGLERRRGAERGPKAENGKKGTERQIKESWQGTTPYNRGPGGERAVKGGAALREGY